jgi:hypothetical protein
MQLSHAATVFNPTSRSLDQSTNLPSDDGPQPKPELEAIHTAHAAPQHQALLSECILDIVNKKSSAQTELHLQCLQSQPGWKHYYVT